MSRAHAWGVLERRSRHGAAFMLASLLGCLSGCANQAPSPVDDPVSQASGPVQPRAALPAIAPSVVTVKRGDTLYAIAFERGLNFQDIASWNAISAPYTIYPGQRLRMAPPEAGAPPVAATGESAVAVAKVAPAPRRQDFQALPDGPRPPGLAVPTEPPGKAPASAPDTPPQNRAASGPHADSKPATASPAVATTTQAQGLEPMAAQAITQPKVATAVGAAPSKLALTPPASPPAGSGLWRWPTEGKVAVAYGVAGRKGIVIGGVEGQSVTAARDGEVVYAGGGLLGYGQLVIVKHDEVYLSAYGNNSRLLVKEGAKVKAGEPIAEMGASGDGKTGLHFELRKHGRPMDPLTLLKTP